MNVQKQARDAGQSNAMKTLARVGYAARGIVYAVVGVLALMLAFGRGGATVGPRGAVQQLAQVPFGKVLLWIVAVGMAGFVLWRLVQATLPKEPWQRAGHVLSALLYGALLVATVRVLQGSSTGSGDGTQGFTAKLMEAPFGRALVAVVGVAVISYGVYELINGYTAKFERKLRLDGIAAQQSRTVRTLSRFGVMARGAVWVLMGVFFLRSAIAYDPSEAKGIGGALASLAEQPFGTILLAIVAAGLVAYAVYSFVEARYRRLEA